MFRQEIKKIVRNPMILFTLLIFMVLNVFFIYRSECMGTVAEMTAHREYNKTYEKIQGMDAKKAVKYLKNKIENDDELQYFTQESYSLVLKEVKKCAEYSKYLENNKKAAAVRNKVAIFKEEDAYSERSTQKTLSVLAKLEGHKLEIGPSKGVRIVMESTVTDIFGILLILFACAVLVTKEFENGAFLLLKTYAAGRAKLMRRKLYVIMLFSGIVCLLLYAGNVVMAYQIYGFGDLGRYLQSVYSYRSSGFNGSVGMALISFGICKVCIYMLIGMILALVTVLCKRAVWVYAASGAVFGISAILYYGIGENSFLSLIKNVNIVAYMNTYRFFQSYRNINLFGNPVDYFLVFLVTICVVFFACFFVTTYIFSRQKIVSKEMKLPAFVVKWRERMVLHKGFGWIALPEQESYKIFWKGKVLLFLAFFIFLTAWNYSPVASIYSSADDMYYKQYMDKLAGTYSEEKSQWIDTEQKRFEDLEKKRDEEYASTDSQVKFEAIQAKYDKLLRGKKAIGNVRKKADYLKTVKGGGFFYESGFSLLTRGKYAGQSDITYGLIAVIMLIISCSYIYSYEYERGMMRLLRTTPKGRGRLRVTKTLLGAGIVMIIALVTYAPWYYRILSSYGTTGLHLPVCSMKHVAKCFDGVTVLQYLVLITLMRVVGLILMMLVCFWLSCKTKSYIMTMIVAICLFILPLLASLCGIHVADYCLFNPLIIGNVF